MLSFLAATPPLAVASILILTGGSGGGKLPSNDKLVDESDESLPLDEDDDDDEESELKLKHKLYLLECYLDFIDFNKNVCDDLGGE